MGKSSAERVARSMYLALDGQHAEVVSTFLDDESLLHVSGGSGLAGDYQGRDAILGLLARMAELTDGTLSSGDGGVIDLMGDAFVLSGSVSGTRKGRRIDTVIELTGTVTRGILREVSVSHQDQPAYDRFWS